VKAEDRITYLQAIWSTFQSKAKTQRPMSPAEYHVAAKWADRNIPLPVVLRGLHEFSGQPRRLEAVVASVERAEEYWFQAMGGIE
jgi:hypothetical protein